MSFAFHTNSWWRTPLDETMRKLAAIGYAGIEIAPHPASFPFTQWTEREAVRLREIAAEAGLKITNLDLSHAELLGSIAFEPSLMAAHAQQREHRIAMLRRAMSFAAALGTGLVSFPTGPIPPFMPRSIAMEHLIEGIEAVLGWAADLDVALAVEPCPGHLIGSYADYIELWHAFAGSKFGLCYDIANAHAVFEDSAAVVANASDLLHVHLADATERDPFHLLPGAGELNITTVLRTLEATGYSGFGSIKLASTPEAGGADAANALTTLMDQRCRAEATATVPTH